MSIQIVNILIQVFEAKKGGYCPPLISRVPVAQLDRAAAF